MYRFECKLLYNTRKTKGVDLKIILQRRRDQENAISPMLFVKTDQ